MEERWHEELVLRQSPDVPGTVGTFEGHEGLRAVQQELRESYDGIVWDPIEVRDLGEGRYAVRVRVSGVGRGSGIALADELGHLVADFLAAAHAGTEYTVGGSEFERIAPCQHDGQAAASLQDCLGGEWLKESSAAQPHACLSS